MFTDFSLLIKYMIDPASNASLIFSSKCLGIFFTEIVLNYIVFDGFDF